MATPTTPTSPDEVKLPQRSGTVSSGITRRTSISEDEAIPDTDSSEVCAWYCGENTPLLGYSGTPQ